MKYLWCVFITGANLSLYPVKMILCSFAFLFFKIATSGSNWVLDKQGSENCR